MSFCRRSTHKARKSHYCDWCGQPISAGTVYVYSAGMFEGEFSTLKYHVKCQAQVDMTLASEGASSYELNELRDIYNDYYKNKETER